MQSEIISFLKQSDGYLSGEEISRHFKISRAGIWKNIQELRKEGYDIVAVPHLGYRLLSSPDKLFPREIQYNLKTKVFGQKVIYHEAINSTMDEAFRLAMENAAEGTVVCAEMQNKGRGRMGRHWNSPKGKGIYMSIILRPSFTPTEVARLTLMSALAVREAIQKVCGISTKIKWPNDLLVGSKKVAGILTEMSAEMDRVRFVVIGFGINVNTNQSALPVQATSLKNESKKIISRIELVQEILRSLENWYERLTSHGFTEVIEEWKKASSTLGKRIAIVDPSGRVEGEAIDLESDGSLLIRNDAGLTIKRMTGDVVQIR